jgi:hypothetical protein
MLLSPLGERLGEGVLQEKALRMPPHLASPSSGGEEYEVEKHEVEQRSDFDDPQYVLGS